MGAGKWVVCIPVGSLFVVFLDDSSPCDLLPSPGSSDVLIKSDLRIHKAEEETGIYFKRLTDPVVTLMEFSLRSEVLGGAFLL